MCARAKDPAKYMVLREVKDAIVQRANAKASNRSINLPGAVIDRIIVIPGQRSIFVFSTPMDAKTTITTKRKIKVETPTLTNITQYILLGLLI